MIEEIASRFQARAYANGQRRYVRVFRTNTSILFKDQLDCLPKIGATYSEDAYAICTHVGRWPRTDGDGWEFTAQYRTLS